jgi:hypothetical protein
MDNITRLKAAAALHAVTVLLNELDRVHWPGYTKWFLDEHHAAINAALVTLERALETKRPKS